MTEEIELLTSDFIMRYYVDERGTYLGGWDLDPPPGALEVLTPPAIWDQVWNFESSAWSESPSQLAMVEAAWREEQMPLAQQTVTALTYGEEGIPGTIPEWQKYWLALRKWTEGNPDFPDETKRPPAPG